MLDRAFQKKMSRELLNFVKVLARRGRFEAVRPVQIAARRLLNELRGRVEVQLTSAAPIDAATNQLILARLKSTLGRDVDLRTRVDPELIGGMVIRVGDTVYDGSISNQLQQLRGELVARAATTLRSQSDRFAVAN
jgi:F-type H+-transporting ATPase subunit delta